MCSTISPKKVCKSGKKYVRKKALKCHIIQDKGNELPYKNCAQFTKEPPILCFDEEENGKNRCVVTKNETFRIKIHDSTIYLVDSLN